MANTREEDLKEVNGRPSALVDIGTLYALAMVRMKWIHFMKYVVDTTEH